MAVSFLGPLASDDGGPRRGWTQEVLLDGRADLGSLVGRTYPGRPDLLIVSIDFRPRPKDGRYHGTIRLRELTPGLPPGAYQPADLSEE